MGNIRMWGQGFHLGVNQPPGHGIPRLYQPASLVLCWIPFVLLLDWNTLYMESALIQQELRALDVVRNHQGSVAQGGSP